MIHSGRFFGKLWNGQDIKHELKLNEAFGKFLYVVAGNLGKKYTESRRQDREEDNVSVEYVDISTGCKYFFPVGIPIASCYW